MEFKDKVGEIGGEGGLCRGESCSLRADVFGRTFSFLPLALVFVNPPANPCPLKGVYMGRQH